MCQGVALCYFQLQPNTALNRRACQSGKLHQSIKANDVLYHCIGQGTFSASGFYLKVKGENEYRDWFM